MHTVLYYDDIGLCLRSAKSLSSCLRAGLRHSEPLHTVGMWLNLAHVKACDPGARSNHAGARGGGGGGLGGRHAHGAAGHAG